jgi:PKD repeat protein
MGTTAHGAQTPPGRPTCARPTAEGCPAPAAAGAVGAGPASLPPGWDDLTAGLSTSPIDRSQPAMAYDPALEEIVLFGGYNPTSGALNDTWGFANNTWTDLSPGLVTAPPVRWGASMVWDASDDYLLLFGGRTNSGYYYNDTWSFTAAGWTNLSTSGAPPARSLFQMAYDPIDSLVIVDGGARSNPVGFGFVSVNDTWAYHGGAWTNISASPPGGALGRAAGNAVYDPWNRSVVFIGGVTGSSVAFFGCDPTAPIQTYVSGSWFEYPTNIGPQNLSEGMAVYDPSTGGIFVFGGYAPTVPSYSCVQVNATWERTNGVWTNVSSKWPTAPSPRYLSGMAYDPTLDEVVLFGGNSQGSYVGDTWVFVSPTLAITGITSSRIGGEAPLLVHLSAAAVGGDPPYEFNWSFGDGSAAQPGASVTHTFASIGVYNVTVTVTDSGNNTTNLSEPITVVPTLSVAANATPAVGTVPLTVRFSGTSIGGGGRIGYLWQFGDGHSGTTADATHTYSSPGNYSATLTVTDEYEDTNETYLAVMVAGALAASATASTSLGVVPLWVNFSSTVGGGERRR